MTKRASKTILLLKPANIIIVMKAFLYDLTFDIMSFLQSILFDLNAINIAQETCFQSSWLQTYLS